MMTGRSILFTLWAVLLCQTATAQLVDEPRYTPYIEYEEERAMPMMDASLFYRAIRSAEDIYAATTEFTLPDVTIHRRGEPYTRTAEVLFGLESPYRHGAMWRMLGYAEEEQGGLHFASDAVGSTGGLRRYGTVSSEPLEPFRVAARYAERNYRFGAQLTYRRQTSGGLLTALAADYRTGRDARIEGVFTDALKVGGRLARQGAGGGGWEVTAELPISMRGLRSASTEEAFRLTNDPWYNPSWGLQGGKVRNARVRREWMPMLLGTFRQPLGATTDLSISAGVEAGIRKQSALGWYDARTPQPDNYRRMPSYTGDQATETVWRSDDVRYTQLDWDELITINRLGDGEAVYALEERVTRIGDLRLRIALHSEVGRLQFDYGLCRERLARRHYKEMSDLLGADYLTDIDHYLIDDDSYANRLENNLRNPSRRIGEGDRFGYDYALIDNRAGGWVHAAWSNHRWEVRTALSLQQQRIHRRGYYEKELFADAGSFGRSTKIELQPYAWKTTVGYTATPRDVAVLTLAVGAEAPDASVFFIQPLYNNRTIDDPALMRHYAAQFDYRRTGETVDWQLTLFATIHLDGIETMRYYDDLSGEYADLTASGIGTSALGIEAALRWRIDDRWQVAAAASWGRYRYIRDPRLQIVTDTDNRPIDEAATAHVGDCRIGGAAETTAVAQVGYHQSLWSVRLSAGWAGGRWVDPSFVRRTDRVARQNGTTPEAFAAFVRQERLGDALTIDLTATKSIRFARTQLTLFCSIRNLLGTEQIAYGYESSRTQRAGTSVEGLRLPQANRYLYGAPRSVHFSIGYRF